jgi:hypothetical protein
VLIGLAALAAWPAAVGTARYSERIGLIEALVGAVPAGLLLALLAIYLARLARRRIQRTIGRSRGGRTAGFGRVLGVAGICAALTGALALGFFGLLQLFAR